MKPRPQFIKAKQKTRKVLTKQILDQYNSNRKASQKSFNKIIKQNKKVQKTVISADGSKSFQAIVQSFISKGKLTKKKIEKCIQRKIQSDKSFLKTVNKDKPKLNKKGQIKIDLKKGYDDGSTCMVRNYQEVHDNYTLQSIVGQVQSRPVYLVYFKKFMQKNKDNKQIMSCFVQIFKSQRKRRSISLSDKQGNIDRLKKMITQAENEIVQYKKDIALIDDFVKNKTIDLKQQIKDELVQFMYSGYKDNTILQAIIDNDMEMQNCIKQDIKKIIQNKLKNERKTSKNKIGTNKLD